MAGAMAAIARAGVALLALCGIAEAFFASPPQTSARTNARARVSQQAELPRWQGHHHVSSVEFGARVRGGGAAVLRASSEEPSADVASSSARPPVDFAAMGKYLAGTGVEFGIIMGVLSLLQGNVLPRLGAKGARAAVFFTFGFLAMKSRTFGVLNARRPKLSTEKDAKIERKRPDWMPPVKVFPVIWITIGVLRATSSTMIWEALGNKLVTTPIAAMVLHLSVGDTWNHINNAEKRLGVAVPVVFLVWLSVANAAFQYYRVLPKAGLVILPSVIWITVANLLVQSIWRLNGRETLYPAKRTSQ